MSGVRSFRCSLTPRTEDSVALLMDSPSAFFVVAPWCEGWFSAWTAPAAKSRAMPTRYDNRFIFFSRVFFSLVNEEKDAVTRRWPHGLAFAYCVPFAGEE